MLIEINVRVKVNQYIDLPNEWTKEEVEEWAKDEIENLIQDPSYFLYGVETNHMFNAELINWNRRLEQDELEKLLPLGTTFSVAIDVNGELVQMPGEERLAFKEDYEVLRKYYPDTFNQFEDDMRVFEDIPAHISTVEEFWDYVEG